MPEENAFPILEIAKLVGSGLIAATITQILAWVREVRRDRAMSERDARYLALRVAIVLERFAIDCADSLYALDMHEASSGAAGTLPLRLPELGDYPTDADWKAVSGALAHRALTLRNELLVASRTVSGSWEFLDADDVAQECCEQTGRLGYRAWTLAAGLREKYGLPPLDTADIGYDFVETLQKMHEKVIEARRKEREAVGKL
ncbi:DUF4320 family protein [Roseomonas sp. HJA6]|uniref:DUF4320 family protein n=1 Tax=Roseomonas alba TaxID=2846776 RepID=A0ABS7A420_9PROT|nr:DUF4320 family protein [Neoroseomonas alba]MBW6397046.1 DUF4320 family protein [Neoroseomonas alba]